VDRPESPFSPQKIGVWQLDMEDRTSRRFGSHGFSRIRRVWLAGRGLRLGLSHGFVGNRITGVPWSRRHHPTPPTGDRTSERSDFPPAPSGLSLTDPPDPLSLSISQSLSDSQHLSLSLSISLPHSHSLVSLISLISVSLSLLQGEQQRRRNEEGRRIKEKEVLSGYNKREEMLFFLIIKLSKILLDIFAQNLVAKFI